MRGTLHLRDGSDLDPNSSLLWVITDVEGGEEDLRLSPDSRMTIRVPSDSQWLNDVKYGRVFRRELNSTVREWRITHMTSDITSGLVEIEAAPFHTILRDIDIVKSVTSGGITYWNIGGVSLDADLHVRGFIEAVLDIHGISWIRVGTIDSTKRFDARFDGETLLEAVLSYAESVNGEFALVRNGSQYDIDIRDEVNGSVAQVFLSESRDLLDFAEIRSPESFATVIVPRGHIPKGGINRVGCGQATWEVTAVSGLWVTLAARTGGRGPVQADGMYAEQGTAGDFRHYVAPHYLRKANGALTKITGSDATLQRVQVEDAGGIQVDDDVQITADSAGTLVTEVHSVTGMADSGRVLGRLDLTTERGEANFVQNPFGNDWAGTQRFQRAQLGSDVLGSTISLQGLPANYSIPAGTLLGEFSKWSWFRGGTSSTVDFARTTTAKTANGSGEVTGLPFARYDFDDLNVGQYVWLLDQGTAPDDLTHVPDQWGEVQDVGTSSSSYGLFQKPLAIARVTVEGSGDSAPVTNAIATKHTTQFFYTVQNFPANTVLRRGDILASWESGALNRVVGGQTIIANDVTLDANGEGQVDVFHLASQVDVGGDVIIRRPAWSGIPRGTSVIMVGGRNERDICRITSPTFRVPVVEGMTRLQATMRYMILSTETAVGWDANESPSLELWDVTNDVLVDSATANAITLPDQETDDFQLVINTTAPTVSTEYELRYKPLTGIGGGQGVMVYIYFAGAALLEGGTMVPIEGSHGTKLWQAGLDRLDDLSSWVTSLEGERIEFAQRWALDPADPALTIGGTVHVHAHTTNTNERFRLAGHVLPLIEEVESLTFVRRLPGIAEQINTQPVKESFVRIEVEVTTSGGDTATVEQTVLTGDSPPDQSGSQGIVVGEGDDLPSEPPALAPLP